ncbi:MAG: septum formation inhibitor Maf [Clostridium sp.]|nr:septum formation inhibitor Maf [Clostridium sp.]
MIQIVLASASPRRSKLLEQIGLDFKIIPPKIKESIDDALTVPELVQELAYKKALNIANISKQKSPRDRCLIIGADTVVVKNGILGKPKNEREAFNMLKLLNGDWHKVLTGIAIVDTKDFKCIKSFETTHVKMKLMSDDTLLAYVDSKEPMDKAGAYGIQGRGAVLVERVEGCYFNVVGLPLAQLVEMLNRFGVSVL